MKILRTIWIPISLLVVWLTFSWFLGPWIGIHQPGLIYLRGGLSILGIVGFVGYLILRPRIADAQTFSPGEVDDNFNEAVNRLEASGVKQIASLPAVFFFGDSDSAKTSVIAKSDVAQLLAGLAMQDVAIVPTRSLNLWLAKRTVLIDPAGALLDNAEQRKRLFRRFSPVAIGSVFGSRQLPSRAIVFTVSCDSLLQKGGAEAMAAKARHFQAILGEAAQEIGSNIPVYVLFTKADKLSYFRDYVENLSEQEASDVLGVTLPMEAQQGVYAQVQTKRVEEAFQSLFYQLADRRPAYLIREHKPAALPNIYEFPREFNKLKTLVTSFLVDLCRPNQVGLSPYLRGFYFTGLRAVMVSDVAPAALQLSGTDESAYDSGATRMFTPIRYSGGAPIAADARELGARKTAQWVYLPQFLPGVVLADSSAASLGSGSNVRLNTAKRFLWGGVAAAALLMSLWWTISFSKNRELVNTALNAANNAPASVSRDGLERLNKIKETLEKLNYFEEAGRPWNYGAFLYAGDDEREPVRRAYYGLFRRYLLQPTQEDLRQVCSAPSSAQPQAYLYDTLKSYLITTEFHNKSSAEYLTPVLMEHWKKVHPPDQREEELARLNFNFYSRELLKHNEYWPQTTADGAAKGNCREFLNRLGQSDQVYRAMLADARGQDKAIIFNVTFPGTETTVVNRYPVEAEFTKVGFERFQGLLKNIGKYSNPEPWVLGDRASGVMDKNKLLSDVQQLYRDEYIGKWLAYLRATRVLPYGPLTDVRWRLDQLSNNHSALLQALCLASENTAVANTEISSAFQPVQTVTPPGCTLQLGTAAGYMPKLAALLEAVKMLDVKNPDSYTSANRLASEAETTVKTIAYGFKGQSDNLVVSLLRAPIYHAGEGPDPDAAKLNDSAAATCQAAEALTKKYPFNSDPNAPEASLSDIDSLFKKSDGAFWKLANSQELTALISQAGDTFRAKESTRAKVRPQFVAYLNKWAHLAHVLYERDNGQTAGFNFSVKPIPSSDIEHIILRINGQTLSTGGNTGQPGEFNWPGNKEGASLKVQWVGGGSEFNAPPSPGLWGVWRFMELSTQITPQEFEWQQGIKGRPQTVGPDNHPTIIRFNIDPAVAQVLNTRNLHLTCESRATIH